MYRSIFICLTTLAAGCASLHGQHTVSAEPIIAAERAFAADAAQRGWAAAFRTSAAPEAITLSPDPVNAQENLARIEGDGSTALDWRPAYAGISQGGEFGFTTGPFQNRGQEAISGHYFTVWRRQPDGGWKWIFDAGTSVADPGPIVALDADVPMLPAAAGAYGSAGAAIAQVAQIETQIANGNALPQQALKRWLAQDARVNRPGAPPAVGHGAAEALLDADGPAAYRSLRREAAASGDLVFSLGEVRDRPAGEERLRYYARMWQRRAEGWRIVFDEIVPRRDG